MAEDPGKSLFTFEAPNGASSACAAIIGILIGGKENDRDRCEIQELLEMERLTHLQRHQALILHPRRNACLGSFFDKRIQMRLELLQEK